MTFHLQADLRDIGWVCQELVGARLEFSGLQSADDRQVAHRISIYALGVALARGFQRELELETLSTLKVTNHFEQIARLRVPGRAEHAHQTFCGSFRDATELLKPDCRVDVVAQNRFSLIEISGQERLHAFTKEFLPVFSVLLDAGLHRFLELARERHRHVSCGLRFL